MTLINRLQEILKVETMDNERALVKTMSLELGIEPSDLAAALLVLAPDEYKINLSLAEQKVNGHFCHLKMVRYRLDVGSQHQVTIEELKKILVNESGVDKNNINNVNIQSTYTLIEMPDDMPQDIFVHLKTVEINNRKLDIKRLKTGNYKKRGKNRSRRGRHRNTKLTANQPEHVNE